MLLDLIFPPSCLACGTPGARFLCATCEAALPWIRERCARCGRPTREAVPECSDCRSPAPAFVVARAPFAYRGPARDALMTFKLGGERRAARPMAAFMVRDAEAAGFEVVTFVPSMHAQIAERGFNTADELARALASELRAPYRRLLAKVRATVDQAGLGREDRRRNQKGAFRARRPVRGRVLLVDDVMTTGATADACARALRAAGADEVAVVTFARAGKDWVGRP